MTAWRIVKRIIFFLAVTGALATFISGLLGYDTQPWHHVLTLDSLALLVWFIQPPR